MKFVVKTSFQADGKTYAAGDVVTRERLGPNLDVAVHRGLVAAIESDPSELDVLGAFIAIFAESGKGAE